MTVRNPLKENTDIGNPDVLSGAGADVGTGVLGEDEIVVDMNDEDGIPAGFLDESGGGDTNTEVDDISDTEIDSMLNEADEEDFIESQIDNFGDEKAPPFTKEDGGAKKEAEEDGKEKKDPPKEDDKKADGEKEEPAEGGEKEKDDKEPVKEDFDDPDEIINPTLYTDVDDIVVEEFGEIPDVIPELPDEPVVDLGDDDGLEIDLESGVSVPAYEVETPFILPESRRMVVGKGDMIFFCGKAKKDIPSFAESTFSQAVKLLVKSKNLKGAFLSEGKKNERVALIGRSCLVEVARDWRMPGTDTIFEAGDIIQIVSRKQVSEKEVKTKK